MPLLLVEVCVGFTLSTCMMLNCFVGPGGYVAAIKAAQQGLREASRGYSRRDSVKMPERQSTLEHVTVAGVQTS